ncbi:DUF11 domain-containing protein [candidate division KSB1 bacterium]|nr:DUF11 domain-containing protein [candidate division KSB1 bacterium]
MAASTGKKSVMQRSSKWRSMIAIAVGFMFISGTADLLGGEFIVPPENGDSYFQANGPNGALRWGDWWTNLHPEAGAGTHEFNIIVPQDVNPDFLLEIQVFDPECYKTGDEIDEIRGNDWDTTLFYVTAPDGFTEITRREFLPVNTTSENWYVLTNFRVGDYGHGVYKLACLTSNDDQNAFRLKITEADPDAIPHTGDEISLMIYKSSIQSIGNWCDFYYFYVPPRYEELVLSNFDMDDKGQVTYTDPNGQAISGTVSGEGIWNTSDEISLPPPGGDIFTNPVSGWWQVELCDGTENQYVFYSGLPMFFQEKPDYPVVIIEKTADPHSAITGGTIDYQIIVTNNGTGLAMNTIVTDTLPDAMFLVVTDGTAQTISGGHTAIAWAVDNLLPLQSDTLHFTAIMGSPQETNITNWAYLEHSDVFGNFYQTADSADIKFISQTLGSIGDRIWFDTNSNGYPDPEETGIEGVVIYLVDVNGDTLDAQTSNAMGYYLFQDVPPGVYVLLIDQTTLPQLPDMVLVATGNPNPTVLVQGGDELLYMDFGYTYDLVPVELSSFTAQAVPGKITLLWTTQSETENLGFYVLRSNNVNGIFKKLNKTLIEGAGNSVRERNYSFEDTEIQSGEMYYYLLHAVDYAGKIEAHGPIQATAAQVSDFYRLDQNYPNPFNAETLINIRLYEAGDTRLVIYNLIGQQIRELISEYREAGDYTLYWDGFDDRGQQVPTGIYLYRLIINDFTATRKMTFTK